MRRHDYYRNRSPGPGYTSGSRRRRCGLHQPFHGLRSIINMREVPKVALLVETSRGFGREFLLGLARYSRLHGPWSFHITPGDRKQVVPKMKQWGGTGIIARIADQQTAKAVLDANLPTIAIGLTDDQMSPGSPLARFSEVSSDPVEVSRLAAEHLIGHRLSHFAYVGSDDRGWSDRREKTFQAYLLNV